eukprot:4420739-Amphidinium_carterae.1
MKVIIPAKLVLLRQVFCNLLLQKVPDSHSKPNSHSGRFTAFLVNFRTKRNGDERNRDSPCAQKNTELEALKVQRFKVKSIQNYICSVIGVAGWEVKQHCYNHTTSTQHPY